MPTWHGLHSATGEDLTAQGPAICQIGCGWYAFDLTKGALPWQEAILSGVIDGGATLSGQERYLPILISEQSMQRQAALTLRETTADHKAVDGSLAADINLMRQALCGKRSQEITTGTMRIYDTDEETVLRTLQPHEREGILSMEQQ